MTRQRSHNIYGSSFFGTRRIVPRSQPVSTRTQSSASLYIHITCSRYMLYSPDSLGFSTGLPTSYRRDSEEPRKNKQRTRRTRKVQWRSSFQSCQRADQSCQIHFIDKLTISKTNFYQRVKNAPAITNSSFSPCLRSQTLRIKLYASSALSTSQVLHSLTFQAHLQAQCCIPWSIRISSSQVLHLSFKVNHGCSSPSFCIGSSLC